MSKLAVAAGCGLTFNAQSPMRRTRSSPELENEQRRIDFGMEAGVDTTELEACDDAGTGCDEHSDADIRSQIDNQPTKDGPFDEALVAVSRLLPISGELSALDLPPDVISHPHLNGKKSVCDEDVKPECVRLREALVIRHMLRQASDGSVADVLRRAKRLLEHVAAACTDLLTLCELDCNAMAVQM